MNRKVILIENRPTRQKIYLPNQEKDQEKLLKMHFLTHYSNDIKNDLNKKDFNFLLGFDLIMIHRSFLNELSNGSAVNAIVKFCEQHQKDLIYFSGGISASSFIQQDEFNFLLINSKDFYANLLDFLDGYYNGEIENLLELKYGKTWKLTYLLRLREFKKLEWQGEEIDVKSQREMNELFADDELVDLDRTIDLIMKEI